MNEAYLRELDDFRKGKESTTPDHREIDALPLSRERLTGLLSTAYHASYCPDEGRYPRFTLLIRRRRPTAKSARYRELVRFPPVRLEGHGGVQSLRRLAPVAAAQGVGLDVRGDASGILCDGLILLRQFDEYPPSDLNTDRGFTLPQGLLVRVNGPVEIRCYLMIPSGSVELKAGRISIMESVLNIPAVRSWLEELGHSLQDRCAEVLEEAEFTYFRSYYEPGVCKASGLWPAVLDEAVRMGHGGAFVVLNRPESAPIDRNFSADGLDLGAAILEHWRGLLAWIVHAADDSKDRHALNHERDWGWHALRSRVSALARLSAIDGCVVLDRALRVHCFGSKIEAEKIGSGSGRKLVDWETKEEIGEEQIQGYGTRQRSAIRLCQAVEGALVFVISQDGDLRVLFSDAAAAYRVRPLEAHLKPDRW